MTPPDPLRTALDLWRMADDGSEFVSGWNGAIECIQREVVDRLAADTSPQDYPLDYVTIPRSEYSALFRAAMDPRLDCDRHPVGSASEDMDETRTIAMVYRCPRCGGLGHRQLPRP